MGFFAKHVAQELGTSTNTLRRWALELEKEGYIFSRNNKGKDGHRIFFQHDVNALATFRDLVDQLQDYQEAAKIVVARGEEVHNDEITPSVNEENEHAQPVKVTFTEQELKEYTNAIIQETSARVAAEVSAKVAEETSARVAQETAEAVYKKLENRLEMRDYELINQIKEIKEQRRLEIAAAQEELSPGFWSRLFGRK